MTVCAVFRADDERMCVCACNFISLHSDNRQTAATPGVITQLETWKSSHSYCSDSRFRHSRRTVYPLTSSEEHQQMCFLRLCVCIYALISLTAASAFLFGDCAHSVLFSSSLISSLFSSHLNMACDSLASLFLSYLCSLFSSFFSSLSSPSQSAGVSVDLLLSSVLLLTPEKPRD